MVSPLLRPAVSFGAVGVATAKQFIPNFKIWQMLNLDSGQTLQGQFEAEGVERSIATNWAEFTSLNRQNPISQFLNGSAETLTFDSVFRRAHALDLSPRVKLDLLTSWTKIVDELRRPPILQFWIGDGHVMMNCVVLSVSMSYGRPDFFGELREVSFSVSLKEFVPFSLDSAEQTDTRYARAGERDYFELLALDEYGNPMLGDVIRKQHPKLQSLESGDVVRLPSIEGVRSIQVRQASTSLKTGFGRIDTPQRRLRLQFFEKRSGKHVSHVSR